MAKMRAWRTGSSPREFELVDAPIPSPAPDELLISVIACGICRTDLHVIDQEIPVHRDRVIPGHQVVGQVVQVGSDVRDVTTGTLVGVAWLHQTCGACEWCRSGAENLCPNSRYTGWDVDGGFAEFVTAPAAYVYRLADDAEHVNPNGGAIALGHPLGMSGTRLALTAAHQMGKQGGRRALATMCVGVGQGVSLAMEKV